MLLRYPDYFERFRCIASQCADSCCKEWEVQVDDDTAQKYLAMDGALGADLRKFLRREDDAWYLTVTEGRCPMWRQDGLCRIQAEQGHDALCQTCRDFPRLTHDYGSFTERGLELSCPTAAALILSGRHGWIEKEVCGGEDADYDPADMQILLETRDIMLTILSDESRPVPHALALALLYGYQAQALLDGEDSPWDEAQALSFGHQLARKSEPAELLRFYRELEILTDTWRQRLQQPTGSDCWDKRLLALARYGIERYYLQAISDFDLVGRVKMVILSCLLVHHLGGDFVQTAQLYGKEIENNDDNIDALLQGAYASPLLTDDRILGLLLL